MRYISQNCRGLGSTLKEEAMKDLVRIHIPEILLVQETKMEETATLQAGKKFWKKVLGLASTPEVLLEASPPFGTQLCMTLKLRNVRCIGFSQSSATNLLGIP